MTAAAASPSSRPWIVGAGADLVMFIATPALLLPLVWLALQGMSPATFNTWATAFGAQGHHLPGMLRAYGDTQLYERFKLRFVLAPLLFFGASLISVVQGLQGLELIAYSWGIWHAAMQTHGFLRIYDAKLGATAAARARWDFRFCAAWFVGGALFSPLRLHYVLHLATTCGAPMPTPQFLSVVRWGAAAVLLIVTAGAIRRAARDKRAGIAVNYVKWSLATSSIAFWWFVNVTVQHPLLGLPLFEIFHDVQYLAIVWLHMRRRFHSGAPMRAWLRGALDRHKLGIAIYLLLVLAYGALRDPWDNGGLASRIAIGFFIASQLLHFYYDGFIWKMRDATTRTGLALPVPKQVAGRLTGHHGKWAAAFVAVVWLLAAGQQQAAAQDTAAREVALSALVPEAATSWYALGEIRRQQGDPVGAVAAYDEALKRVPNYAAVQEQLGFTAVTAADTQRDAGDLEGARATMQLAQHHLPTLASRLNDEGLALSRDGQTAAAERLLTLATDAEPTLAAAQLNLAVLLWQRGALPQARRAAAAGLALRPEDALAKQLVQRLAEAP